MKKRNVNSFKLLTPEDKQYLRRVCRYLGSLGMEDGSIEMELDNSDFDFSEINWDNETHFSNNYGAEVPDGLKPILKKVADYIQEKGLFDAPTQEDINYERIDFDIDCKSGDLTINHWWSYYDRGDSASVEYDGEEGKEIFEEWEEEGVFDDLQVPDNGILTLKYNGSGDSGYIESDFEETSDSVPSTIEDWCYRELENHFGGWEINEGSDGEFVFNFHKMTIELIHTNNIQEDAHETVYEESFAE